MKAVIYARYSSDGQREESVKGQLREGEEFADRHNITIVATYIDRAQSAREVKIVSTKKSDIHLYAIHWKYIMINRRFT